MYLVIEEGPGRYLAYSPFSFPSFLKEEKDEEEEGGVGRVMGWLLCDYDATIKKENQNEMQ